MSKYVIPLFLAAWFAFGVTSEFQAHNVGGAITWNREISRVMFQHCVSCHHAGGPSFSLMKFQEVQPRADAVKDAVLSRRMPPWGAVKGFGDFRNDQGLTQAELDLITDWVDSSTPKGNNPNALPPEPKVEKPKLYKLPKEALSFSGDFSLTKPFVLDGIYPQTIPTGASTKIVAVTPDGRTLPLLWLYEYKDSNQHAFLLRKPVQLPAGTTIHGVAAGQKIALIPGKLKSSK